MSLVFVAGAPTSGKTAVAEQLAMHDFDVHDTDDPNRTGMSGWHLLETNEYVAGFNEIPVTPNLFDTHIWKLTDGTIERFKEESRERALYLCGSLREPGPVIQAADFIIFLTTNEETIRHRFTLPREVDWGKEQWQIEKTIARNVELEAEYHGYGATLIDATRPLDMVVDEIIEITA